MLQGEATVNWKIQSSLTSKVAMAMTMTVIKISIALVRKTQMSFMRAERRRRRSLRRRKRRRGPKLNQRPRLSRVLPS